MAESFLSRLQRNPHAPIDGASVSWIDEMGNGYDDWRNIIAPAQQQPAPQSWGDLAYGIGTAPMRFGNALVNSLSPYHQNEHPITDPNASNWQVPPLISESWDAINSFGNAYHNGMSEDDMRRNANIAAGLTMGGGGLAARPAMAAESAAARAIEHPHFNFAPQEFSDTVFNNGTALRYGLKDDGSAVYISKLETPQAEAGRGQARAIMEALTKQADQERIPLELDAQRWGDQTDVGKLREFYRGLGFQDVDHASGYPGYMRRDPVYSDASKEASVPALLRGYHGSDRGFQKFREPNDGGLYSDMNVPHEGIWFANNPSRAEWFANNAHRINSANGDAGSTGPAIYPVDIEFKNPYVHPAELYADEGISSMPSEYEMRQKGHDGAIVNRAKWEYVNGELTLVPSGIDYQALQPNTVRSATTGETLFSNSGSRASPPALASGVGEKQWPTELPPGVRVERSGDNNYLAYAGDVPIGQSYVRDLGDNIQLGNVSVFDPEWQRKGIGSAMYGIAERDFGKPHVPDVNLSDAAYGLWSKYNPQAISDYQRSPWGQWFPSR